MSEQNDIELISIREFARRIGCSDVAVHKAIKTEKIVKGLVPHPNGKKYINPVVALSEWGKQYDSTYSRNPNLTSRFKKPTQDKFDGEGEDTEDKPGHRSLAEVKRLTAEVKLQLEAVALRKAKGELIDKKSVYNALFAAGSAVKNSVMTVPDRYIDAILAAPTRNDAHTILTQALIDALSSVSDTELSGILETNTTKQ